MSDLSAWLAAAGLGAFHGVNPAMGWLFAVALGLQRESRGTVLLALVPIALGHAVAVAAMVAAVIGFGAVIELDWLRYAAAALLVGWAGYVLLHRHGRRVRIGMTTGLAGLGVWSFAMASMHGAGMMLVPALLPLSLADTDGAHGSGHSHALPLGDSLAISMAAVALHTLVMLAVAGAIAVAVYEWLGLGFLRRAWINLDLIWAAALAGAAIWLLVG